jgi:hypothetical protein
MLRPPHPHSAQAERLVTVMVELLVPVMVELLVVSPEPDSLELEINTLLIIHVHQGRQIRIQ